MVEWSRLVIAIVGGDHREQEIARCAVAAGAEVRAYGFPWPGGGIEGVLKTESAAAALDGAHVALFPIPGIAPDGALFALGTEERIVPDAAMLGRMVAPAHIILGWADAGLKAHCAALGITLDEYEWDQDLMLLRGPAIVEGMLRVMIENTEITIHRANVCQIGQGSIGGLVTRTLIGLGARVHVAARNAVQRAAAYAAGAESHELSALPDLLSKADIVVSSVPSRVVGRELLGLFPKHALIVDLAAPPGGFDREAIAQLGIKYVWARGMGRRAPVTVGRSQWTGIRKRIEAHF
jgi:dipicolinate synthase subunit A